MHWLIGPRLGDILLDEDNGFGVLRLMAALAVVFSHSFYLLTHVTASEPLYNLTGFTLGQHAVHVFFAVSGLLVTASLARTAALTDYLLARLLRVFPALAVCTVLTAFLLGPFATSLPLSSYFTSAEPYLYVLKTAGLVTGNAPLPGVFDTNPVAGEVNIPVWTLKYEVICYLALAALAVAGVFRSWAATTVVIVATVAAYLVPHLAEAEWAQTGALDSLSRLGLCFMTGVAAFVMRDTLRFGLAAVVIAGAAYALFRGTGLEVLALVFFTASLSFAVASAQFGRLADWTRGTDISYGTYIYGWPLMQLMVSLFPGISQLQLFALTLVLLIPVAYLSWLFVEKPALALKRRRTKLELRRLRRKLITSGAPISSGTMVQRDGDGGLPPPPPSRRRVDAAIRISPRDRLRVVRT